MIININNINPKLSTTDCYNYLKENGVGYRMIGRPNNPRQLNVILKTDTQEGILNGIRLEGKEWEGRRLAVQVTFL